MRNESPTVRNDHLAHPDPVATQPVPSPLADEDGLGTRWRRTWVMRPSRRVSTYKFESKWEPDVSSGAEVHGRCQHPIVEGSGRGGFDGVTGRVDFKDIVADGSYLYRGHLRVP